MSLKDLDALYPARSASSLPLLSKQQALTSAKKSAELVSAAPLLSPSRCDPVRPTLQLHRDVIPAPVAENAKPPQKWLKFRRPPNRPPFPPRCRLRIQVGAFGGRSMMTNIVPGARATAPQFSSHHLPKHRVRGPHRAPQPTLCHPARPAFRDSVTLAAPTTALSANTACPPPPPALALPLTRAYNRHLCLRHRVRVQHPPLCHHLRSI